MAVISLVPMNPGLPSRESWNESRCETDTATGAPVRILTPQGRWQMGPPYHGRGAFSADGCSTILCLEREGGTGLVHGTIPDGELRWIWWEPNSPEGRALDGAHALHETNGKVVFRRRRSLLMVDVGSAETTTLVADVGEGRQLGCPAWSLDGRSVFISHYPVRPREATPPLPTTYERVDAVTGERTVLWEDPLGACNHIQVCPSDGDLLLIDRNLPPGYAYYGDYRATSRAWLLNQSTAALTELRPRDDEWRFQMHTNFNRDGTRIYYHGRACPRAGLRGEPMDETPQYVGVCDLRGNVLWQHVWPTFFYGHVAPDQRGEAILVDGTLSSDLLCSLHYAESGPDGPPRVELLGRHGSTWDRKFGQAGHPHPVMTPDGRHILFCRTNDAERSELVLLEVQAGRKMGWKQ